MAGSVTAAWLWGRSELRARWRSWVILGVLAGATFGLAAAGLAGARRTSVALPRFIEVAHFPTAALLANDSSFDAAKQRAVAELPEVQRVYPFEIAILIQDKPINDGGGLIPTTDVSAQLFSIPLVEGRATNPARADEIVVDQNLQRRFKLGLGATVTIGQSISPDAIKSIPPGMLAPGVDPNYEQKLTVVGISKSVNSDTSWAPSAGFYAKYGHRTAGFVNEFTTLRRGEADLPRFERDVERIIGHPVNVESFAQLLGIPKVRNLLRVEQDGLLLFALAVLVVGGVLIGQALARAVNASASELPTWRAIGADRGIALRALVAPATVTAVVGATTGVAVAIASSRQFPISQARRFDLDVGVHADWFVLGIAAAAVVGAVMAIAFVSALWALSGRRTEDRSPSWAGKWAARLGLPPALAIGSRLAVEPGRGRRAVPVRSALIGAIVGVIGVVGCFTFRAGLTDAVASPQRSGIVWDFEIASGEGSLAAKDIATITHDHDVKGALHAAWFRAVRVNGVATPTWGTETLKGATTPVVLTGRAPKARDEIAFGPATAETLKLHIGDRVSVGDATTTRATVVGTALVPASSHTDYDQGGWMTNAGLRAALKSSHQLNANDYEDYMFVRWAPGTNIKAAEHRYASLHAGSDAWYTMPATLPTQVVSLGELRSLPLALGVFFALLASATVAHALVTTVRRRRQELAVLRSIGFTRLQTRVAIGWQATLIAVVGLIVGIPLGIGTGQLTWRWLADSFPVVYVAPFALVALLLVIPAAILLANVLAAVPAQSAARIRPAEALRTE